MAGGNTGTGNPPTGTANFVDYGGLQFSAAAGIEEVFRVNTNHSHSELDIADDSFSSTQLVLIGKIDPIWRPPSARIWVRADFFAPGAAGLTPGTYQFAENNVDENGSALADVQFFNDGRIGTDVNNDGDIEADDNEFQSIVGGQFTLAPSTLFSGYRVTFTVVLENGVTVSGFFRWRLSKGLNEKALG